MPYGAITGVSLFSETWIIWGISDGLGKGGEKAQIWGKFAGFVIVLPGKFVFSQQLVISVINFHCYN